MINNVNTSVLYYVLQNWILNIKNLQFIDLIGMWETRGI